MSGNNNWGGQRAGAGRPNTGRKKYNFYITPEEHQLLKQYLEQLRRERTPAYRGGSFLLQREQHH